MTRYKNFQLESEGSYLMGYEWHLYDPRALVYLIHGIGEHAGRYDHVAEYFRNFGISLVSMDLRGHGQSPGKRGHIGRRQTVRKDIDNLIKYIKSQYPDIPLIHYGHSLGGNISLDYRLKGELSAEPKGYLVTSPWVKLVRPISGALYYIVKLGSKIMPKAVISQSIDDEMLGNVTRIKKEENSELRHQKISLHTAVEGFDIAYDLMENKIDDMYGGGKRPILIMHGSKDPICDVSGSRTIAQNYGDLCEYVEWEDYLHELHNGTDEKSCEEILNKMVEWTLKISK